jgi:hypothetical protein
VSVGLCARVRVSMLVGVCERVLVLCEEFYLFLRQRLWNILVKIHKRKYIVFTFFNGSPILKKALALTRIHLKKYFVSIQLLSTLIS